jgi:GT2 family glycosyltransferase
MGSENSLPESAYISTKSAGAFCAVAIGRNEGDRLKVCIESLSKATALIYVDSGSTDGSVQFARERGVDTIELDMNIPFTAARARNSGFARVRSTKPHLRYVQFIDGDCELVPGWTQKAVSFLDSNPDIAAVCGRLRERYPDRSVYNWLCDQEWDGPVGEIRACAGNVMMSVRAFESVGGYRDDLIAGEESELCIRLRRANWRIWRLDSEMALHDAALTKFSQWWRRTERGGYAFAQGASLHGAAPERHWLWEKRRALIWGLYLPAICASLSICVPWGWLSWIIYPAQILRLSARLAGSARHRLVLAFFYVLGRFPESWGVLKFMRDQLLGPRRLGKHG